MKLPKTIKIHLEEVLEHNIESFLDLLSERATGSLLLMDIRFKVVGHDGNVLFIEVNGDPSEIL